MTVADFVKFKIVLRSVLSSFVPITLYSIGFMMYKLAVESTTGFFNTWSWVTIGAFALLWPRLFCTRTCGRRASCNIGIWHATITGDAETLTSVFRVALAAYVLRVCFALGCLAPMPIKLVTLP